MLHGSTPRRSLGRGAMRRLAAAAAMLAGAAGVSAQPAQPALPMQPGELVVTCHSGYPNFSYNPIRPDAFVVAIVKAANPVGQGAPIGSNWLAQQFHNEFQPDLGERWIARNLGEVFGVTLDAAVPPNIYVTATTVYGPFTLGGAIGPAGFGGVYRLDGTTGVVTTLATLPNGTSGLGNICHVRTTNQFFVSNFDDGLIYRLSSTGTVLGTYDHGLNGRPNESLAPIADTPNTDFTPLSRRVWGLEDFQGRLYYSVWAEDVGCTPGYAAFSPLRPIPNIATVENEIWSVALDASGAPIPSTAQREITMPAITNLAGGMPLGPVSSPVSDISFGPNGEMFLSERSMLRDTGWGAIPVHLYNPNDAHFSRLLEFTGSSGSWTAQPLYKWQVGRTVNGLNSAGGNAPDCEGNVWSSGDALIHPNPSIYGLQRIPPGGNQTTVPFTTSASYLIDLDMDTSFHDKTTIGEVDIYDPACDCMSIDQLVIDCPLTPDAPFDVSFSLTNNSGVPGKYILLTPSQPTTGSFVPNQIVLPMPLPDGQKTIVNTQLLGLSPGQQFCFTVTLLSETFNDCCSQTICVDIPECDCFEVEYDVVQCDPTTPGTYTYSFSYINLTGVNIYSLNFWAPAPVVITPNNVDYSSNPIPPFGVVSGSVTITNGTPGEVLCFNVSVHDDHLIDCCAEEICITLPVCDPGVEPDTCHVTKIVPCCPDAAGLPPSGTITLTICNNNTFPQTYNWSATGGPPSSSCPAQLFPSHFSPSFGTVGPIPPGQCASVTITVDCEALQGMNSSCASYIINITSPTNPLAMSCTGVVRQDPIAVKSVVGTPIDLPLGLTLPMSFEITAMTADGAGPFSFDFAESPWGGDAPGNPALSLNGLPMGQTAPGSVVLEQGVTQTVQVGLYWGREDLGLIQDVFVIGDVNQDGQPDVAGSAAARQVESAPAPCPGDTNNDGVVDFTDLNEVLGCFGLSGPVPGDVNRDGTVNFTDLNIVLGMFNSACP
mgnify:CR=1 FL=1